ncbi:hypothetical protein, partial [uncultured Dialister sp.]|uniref:hypothetical protein n=1 Tax=uncultured Dialister sp. TaxID=278064 RepID=UPI00265FA1A0
QIRTTFSFGARLTPLNLAPLEKTEFSPSRLIIASHVETEGFDLPQRGRRLAYLLTVARERGAVFIGFYKRSHEWNEVGLFSKSPYLAVVRFLYKSL